MIQTHRHTGLCLSKDLGVGRSLAAMSPTAGFGIFNYLFVEITIWM